VLILNSAAKLQNNMLNAKKISNYNENAKKRGTGEYPSASGSV
jgi:hypothetical protein